MTRVYARASPATAERFCAIRSRAALERLLPSRQADAEYPLRSCPHEYSRPPARAPASPNSGDDEAALASLTSQLPRSVKTIKRVQDGDNMAAALAAARHV